MVPFYRYWEVGAFSLLNLFPFLLLALHPFRRHLRFSHLVTHALVLVMALAQICLGFLAAFTPIGSKFISLASTIIYAGFFFFLIKDQIGRLTFVLLFFANFGNLVTICAKCLEGLLFGSLALEAYRWSMLICMLVMHVLITLPLGFYVHKYFTSSVPIETKSWRYLWVIPATFYIAWYYHLYIAGQNDLMVALDLRHVLFLVMINLGAFSVYHIAILLLFEQQKNAKLMQNNYLLTMHNIQYESLQQRINEARRIKHDIHHHTHLIREYLRDGKLQELEAYLDQYSASLPNTHSILYCQHYETNSLLGYFANQAQQDGITMDIFVQLPEVIHLPETTLSVLLGNLLENAIDACKEVTGGERKITIRGKASGGFVFFDISNNYSGTLQKTKAGEYRSTKKDGQGLGLNSVAQLVSYHNGVFEIDSSEHVFRVSIMLQEQIDVQR